MAASDVTFFSPEIDVLIAGLDFGKLKLDSEDMYVFHAGSAEADFGADELRAIADKLDEVNGETTPE